MILQCTVHQAYCGWWWVQLTSVSGNQTTQPESVRNVSTPCNAFLHGWDLGVSQNRGAATSGSWMTTKNREISHKNLLFRVKLEAKRNHTILVHPRAWLLKHMFPLVRSISIHSDAQDLSTISLVITQLWTELSELTGESTFLRISSVAKLS